MYFALCCYSVVELKYSLVLGFSASKHSAML